MSNYVKHLMNTPQSVALPGMKKNNAGGYGFQISDQQMLERFLIIGSESGTYYVEESQLTLEHATNIIEMIKNDGLNVVRTIVNVSKENRAPKLDPALFALALACTYGNDLTKQEAYAAIAIVCRTSTHLFKFVSDVNELRGWSRGLRNGVNDFYLANPGGKKFIDYQLVKYRQRDGWTHRDVLRLSHPKTANSDINASFKWTVGKSPASETNSQLIQAFELAQKETDSKKLAKLIKEYNLTWEMIPTEMLNKDNVLDALLENMPVMATVRNLNRFAKAGLTDSNLSDTTKLIVNRITDKELLKKAGIHPIFLLNALKVYSQGHGDKGKSVWVPNSKITGSLNDAFYLAYDAVVPTGKDIISAVDVSGSMESPNIANMALSPREAAAALLLTTVNVEPNVEVLLFDTDIKRAKLNKHTSLEEVLNALPKGGGTDCSLPIRYALDNKVKADCIQIFTDSETWAGKQHAIQALNEYKNKINKDVKVVEVGMVANKNSLFESNKDPNVMHVVGFDASVPIVINKFMK